MCSLTSTKAELVPVKWRCIKLPDVAEVRIFMNKRVLIFILSFAGVCLSACPSFDSEISDGNIPSILIEASGIAAGRKNPGVLWAHNDSGAGAVIYAINLSGELLGTYGISEAVNRDWEDIAIGPGPQAGIDYLYIGDIGGNIANYGTIRIYRIAEPFVDQYQTPVNAAIGPASLIELAYPNNEWYDSETLMVDPWNSDIYIVTKAGPFGVPKLYRAAYPHSTTEVTVLEFVRNLPSNYDLDYAYTGGDISPSGTLIILRKYFSAIVWRRSYGMGLGEALGASGCSVPLADEAQGEAVCFEGRNRGYFTVSEGAGPPLYHYKRNPLDCDEVAEMGYLLQGDINQDCKVDYLDLLILSENWLRY
jgi:hypothetical protein